MSRESSLKGPIGQLEGLAEELIYRPTAEDRKLKIQFLQLIADNPIMDPKALVIEDAERVLGKRLKNKAEAGFIDWFLNKDENTQRLEYLFTLALNAAEEIICNTDPKAQGARVSMVRAIAELAGKVPGKTGPESTGQGGQNLLQSINTMDKAELKMLLEKGGRTLNITATTSQPTTIEVDKK